jgi:hypothetical protein
MALRWQSPDGVNLEGASFRESADSSGGKRTSHPRSQSRRRPRETNHSSNLLSRTHDRVMSLREPRTLFPVATPCARRVKCRPWRRKAFDMDCCALARETHLEEPVHRHDCATRSIRQLPSNERCATGCVRRSSMVLRCSYGPHPTGTAAMRLPLQEIAEFPRIAGGDQARRASFVTRCAVL